MIDVQELLKAENFHVALGAATALLVVGQEARMLLRPSSGLSDEMRRTLTAKFDAIVMPKSDALRIER